MERLFPCQCCREELLGDPDTTFSTYMRMIDDCFSIQVPVERCLDGSQPMICVSCIDKLTESHRFMLMIQESQFALQTANLLETQLENVTPSQEPNDSDSGSTVELADSPPSSPRDSNDTTPKFDCNKCSKSFRFRENLNFHLSNHTLCRKAGQLKCDICRKTFERQESLDFHAKTHSALDVQGDYECNTCHEKFHHVHFYNEHRSKHELHVCDDCDDRFDTAQGLKDHKRRHHKQYRKCDECGRVVAKDSFQRHLDSHTRKPHNVCPVHECRRMFYNNDVRYRHMKEAHDMDIDIFSCDKCPKKFHRQGLLNVHMKSHSGVKKTAVCYVCGQRYESKTLKAHLKTHSGVKNERCPECGKAFLTRWSLKQHLKGHYEYRALKCDHCGDGFTQRISLRTHLAKVHGMSFCL